MKQEYKVTIESSSQDNTVVSTKVKTKTEEANKFTVYLDDKKYLFLKKNGWEYNGMNGFINHLIEEEMKKRGEQ